MGTQSTGQVGSGMQEYRAHCGVWRARQEASGVWSQQDLPSKDWLVQPGAGHLSQKDDYNREGFREEVTGKDSQCGGCCGIQARDNESSN